MVMQSKCPFCEKTYGDAEEHHCDERKAWENTLTGQAEEANKALRDFSRVIMEEAIKSGKALAKIFKNKDEK